MSAISVTAHQSAHASNHDIGGTHDAIGKRVPASVDVVKLELGGAINDVDNSEEDPPLSAIFVTTHQSAHASDQDIGGKHDAIGKRAPASLSVVELGLGDAIIDDENRDEELARVCHARNRAPERTCLQS